MTSRDATRGWQPTLGAVVDGPLTTFRIWAPKVTALSLVTDTVAGRRTLVMDAEAGAEGYRVATVPGAGAGTRYGFLADGAGPFPDPCSRSQPQGVHALSEVVDPSAFAWTDAGWQPSAFEDLVIYECHIGTLTPEGTFDAAIGRLTHLREMGVTAVELMPVAAFPGRWSWGYDGAALFAPSEAYGGPEGLRRLVDAAHREGLAVILDVVYNHFGPDGNYTGIYSSQYLTNSHRTPWGDAINFETPGSSEVRRFYRENLLHWLHEYHIDGIRFDATHAIYDGSKPHILAELATAARESAAERGTRTYLTAESHENDARYVRPAERGGFGFNAVWADDFHHGIRAALCNDDEGYFRGFDGSMRELARIVRRGWLFEGQFDPGYGGARGTRATECPWPAFIYCLQNHDQVGNRPFGRRLHATTGEGAYRAAALLLLLLPQTPLIFQGQEFMASTPFLYFTDHDKELGEAAAQGRRREFAPFRAFSDPATRKLIPDPQSAGTFLASKLDFAEAGLAPGALCVDMYHQGLALRRTDAVLRGYRRERLPLRTSTRGQTLTVHLRAVAGERWIVVNFGPEAQVKLDTAAAARVVLDSNEGRFGGTGKPVRVDEAVVTIPARTTAFLAG